ncbi:MAG TPA: hypothetical protein VMU93_09070 [Caulobacteraceae bacterium]|nr:hypothetical protein [Caulobacteraceae bacterium]
MRVVIALLIALGLLAAPSASLAACPYAAAPGAMAMAGPMGHQAAAAHAIGRPGRRLAAHRGAMGRRCAQACASIAALTMIAPPLPPSLRLVSTRATRIAAASTSLRGFDPPGLKRPPKSIA